MKTLKKLRPACVFSSIMLFVIVAINISGCQPDYVSPPPVPPTASFAYSSTRNFPVMVQFTNMSTNPFPGSSTFIWDFGDGSTSTITNPVHLYTVAGTYQLVLIQIYPNATRDTVSKSMVLNATGPGGVSSKVAGITTTDFTFSVPSSHLVSFTNTSTNATGYLWHFGDATSSTSGATTVTHQYTGIGPFNVKMIASGSGGTDTCSAQIIF